MPAPSLIDFASIASVAILKHSQLLRRWTWTYSLCGPLLSPSHLSRFYKGLLSCHPFQNHDIRLEVLPQSQNGQNSRFSPVWRREFQRPYKPRYVHSTCVGSGGGGNCASCTRINEPGQLGATRLVLVPSAVQAKGVLQFEVSLRIQPSEAF